MTAAILKPWLDLARRDALRARKRFAVAPTNPHAAEWVAPWLRFEQAHPEESRPVEVHAAWLTAFYGDYQPTSWERYGKPKTYDKVVAA